MPPESMADERHSYTIVAKSFPELLEHVRSWRATISVHSQQANISHFAAPSVVVGDSSSAKIRRFYALGTCVGSRDHTILYADIPQEIPASSKADTADGSSSSGATTAAKEPADILAAAAAAGFGETERDELMREGDESTVPVLEWKPLLRVGEDTLLHRGVMTKEEELLRERRRCMIQGITSYDFEPRSGTFIFSAAGHLYRCVDDQLGSSVCPSPVDVPLNVTGAPLDPKICPANPRLVACVCRNDIYVQFGPTARQATFSHEGDDDMVPPRLCGVPSFIIQEEFDRFTGYWWRPRVEDDTYYILYEETDESAVFELSINVPATRAEHVELMRYPRTGTNNPTWNLKLLKISLSKADETSESFKDARIEELLFYQNIRELFPWAEYLVRAGWMPDGNGVWFQLMSRIQDRLALIYAPIEAFRSVKQPLEAESMEDLTIERPAEQKLQAQCVSVLYEEHTPDTWINYHDAVQFLNSNDGEVEFIWCSGKSGFYHLYHVTSTIASGQESMVVDSSNSTTSSIRREVQLTSGEWDVRRKCAMHVDSAKKLIYFCALRESPIEQQIYVTSYEHPGPVRLVSETGYSHGVNREGRPFCISADGRALVTSRCNLTQVGESVVYLLNDSSTPNDPLPQSTLLCKLSKNAGMEKLRLWSPELGQTTDDLPVLYTHDSQRTGFRHYAYLFKPKHAKKGFKYPTVLYVYAGPEVQLVKNVWVGSYGFHKYTSLGYAVVVVDGRGSANRGVQFEKALKRSLGTLEIEDQIEVLTEVANRSGMIDMARVGLLGWSYGGYMALLGLAQRPDVFKVSIAGAPVTVWSLYDTAYTERYMGMPQQHVDAYLRSSVLSHAQNLPSESGRLLLLHGLIDENVHFRHTSTLISALIRLGKPYQLQVFPADRHAVRNTDVSEHMDATVLDFLQRNL